MIFKLYDDNKYYYYIVLYSFIKIFDFFLE